MYELVLHRLIAIRIAKAITPHCARGLRPEA